MESIREAKRLIETIIHVAFVMEDSPLVPGYDVLLSWKVDDVADGAMSR